MLRPSHSSDLTPIEHLWEILEQCFRHRSLPLTKYHLGAETYRIVATEDALACFCDPTPFPPLISHLSVCILVFVKFPSVSLCSCALPIQACDFLLTIQTQFIPGHFKHLKHQDYNLIGIIHIQTKQICTREI